MQLFELTPREIEVLDFIKLGKRDEEIYGINNRVVPPVYILTFQDTEEDFIYDYANRIVAEYSYWEDIEPHLDVALRWLEESGQLWWQRE